MKTEMPPESNEPEVPEGDELNKIVDDIFRATDAKSKEVAQIYRDYDKSMEVYMARRKQGKGEEEEQPVQPAQISIEEKPQKLENDPVANFIWEWQTKYEAQKVQQYYPNIPGNLKWQNGTGTVINDNFVSYFLNIARVKMGISGEAKKYAQLITSLDNIELMNVRRAEKPSLLRFDIHMKKEYGKILSKLRKKTFSFEIDQYGQIVKLSSS